MRHGATDHRKLWEEELKHNLFATALVVGLALAVVAGCGKKDDPIAKAEKKDVAKGVPAPSIAETKAIAEEGFIYGLPIVMNYAVMYEYAVDKQLGPVQGAVQPDQQRGPRLHLQGHGHRHAEQRHALFVRVDGSARRADRAVRPGGGRNRATTRSCSATATPSTTATSAAAPPATRPATTWSSDPTGRARRRPASRRCSVPARNSRWRSTAPSSSIRPTCPTW